jgi:hypothetical protein
MLPQNLPYFLYVFSNYHMDIVLELSKPNEHWALSLVQKHKASLSAWLRNMAAMSCVQHRRNNAAV